VRWDAAIKGVQQVRFPEHLPLNGDVDYPKLEVNPHRAARVVGYDLPYLLLPDVAVSAQPPNDDALSLVERKLLRVGDVEYSLPFLDRLRVRRQDKAVEENPLHPGLKPVCHPAERLENFHHLKNVPVKPWVVRQ
jgi:hypothetical protein